MLKGSPPIETESLRGPGLREGDQGGVPSPLSAEGAPYGGPRVAPLGGVYTFLRIRPPSPSSEGGPSCIGYLEVKGPPASLKPTSHSTEQLGAPGGPNLEAPSNATPHSLRGLPSLTQGKARVVAGPPEEAVAPQRETEGPRDGGPCPSVSRGYAVVILPPQKLSGAPSSKANQMRAPSGAPLRGVRPQKTTKTGGLPELDSKRRHSIQLSLPQQRQRGLGAPIRSGGGPPQEDPNPRAFWGLPVCPPSCIYKKGYEGPFSFSGLFGAGAPQDAVFRAVGLPAAQAFLGGLNACIVV